MVAANQVINNGRISADGANGQIDTGNGSADEAGGGGGGAGGSVLVLVGSGSPIDLTGAVDGGAGGPFTRGGSFNAVGGQGGQGRSLSSSL